MSENNSVSVHLPLTFLILAVSVFLWSQIRSADRSVEGMKAQRENTDSQLAEMRKAQRTREEQLEKQKQVVEQGHKVKDQWVALLGDVIELSKTDADTAEVVEKWKISVKTPEKSEAPK